MYYIILDAFVLRIQFLGGTLWITLGFDLKPMTFNHTNRCTHITQTQLKCTDPGIYLSTHLIEDYLWSCCFIFTPCSCKCDMAIFQSFVFLYCEDMSNLKTHWRFTIDFRQILFIFLTNSAHLLICHKVSFKKLFHRFSMIKPAIS